MGDLVLFQSFFSKIYIIFPKSNTVWSWERIIFELFDYPKILLNIKEARIQGNGGSIESDTPLKIFELRVGRMQPFSNLVKEKRIFGHSGIETPPPKNPGSVPVLSIEEVSYFLIFFEDCQYFFKIYLEYNLKK